MAASGKAGVMDFTKQVREMLEKHTAADLPLLSPVFLNEDVQPVDAFKFLSEHSLRACPVRYVPTFATKPSRPRRHLTLASVDPHLFQRSHAGARHWCNDQGCCTCAVAMNMTVDVYTLFTSTVVGWQG